MDAGRAADLYDAVVVGGGPAGLAAALYLARARYRVLVVEKDTFGGQITITAEVVNYPGVEKTEGHSLTETMRRQALHFGAEFLLAEAQGIDVDGDFRIVRTSRGAFRCFAVLLATGAHPRKVGFEGEETFRGRGVAYCATCDGGFFTDRDFRIVRTSRGAFRCFAVLLATGAHPRKVGFEGEETFRGRGVAYCATCDGGFFTDRDVFVVGGGFAAAEEAMFLTRYARSVTMLVRRSTLSCAESIAEQVLAHESVRVRFNTVLEAVEGDTALRRAVFRDTVTGRLETYAPPEGETFGVFVFAGYEPASRLAEGLAELTGQGNIVTDREQRTRTEGVYAAGDVCDKRLRQVVTAVSDGAVAATSIERYAADMQRKTGLRPQRPATAPASSGASKASAPSGNARETEGGFLTAEQREQLAGVFARMERPLILKAEPDSRPVSEDLRRMLMELAALTDKLTVEWTPPSDGPERPCVRVLRADGTDTGIAFHGVPGGHEFNSFVVGLYNAAGPGQSIDPALAEAIAAIDRPLDLQIVVALSCTMCPELVIAAQKIAASNPLVTAKVYDVNHFPELRERYKIMSVPCLIINKAQVAFGKKTLGQLLELLAEPEAGQTG